MRDLALGCREEVKANKWIYYLKDGTAMPKEEWIKLVKQHIASNGNERVFEKIVATVKLWNHKDDIEEVALQVYVSKYKATYITHLKEKVELKVIKDDMGCDQLVFC
nr:hypothetical protein [uncultured Cellulosilyticum sp.]